MPHVRRPSVNVGMRNVPSQEAVLLSHVAAEPAPGESEVGDQPEVRPRSPKLDPFKIRAVAAHPCLELRRPFVLARDPTPSRYHTLGAAENSVALIGRAFRVAVYRHKAVLALEPPSEFNELGFRHDAVAVMFVKCRLPAARHRGEVAPQLVGAFRLAETFVFAKQTTALSSWRSETTNAFIRGLLSQLIFKVPSAI